MTDKEVKSELPGERLGALLFMMGLIPLVLVATALVKSGSEVVGTPTWMARLAHALVRALGYVPSILLYGSMTTLGGALFLGFSVRRPGRHLLGMVGTSLGAAIIAGAIAVDGGGVLGRSIGGSIASGLGVSVGILIGLAIVTATVVVAYLDGKIPMPKRLGTGATLSTALTELDDAGVSNAESSALAADASTLAYMEALWKTPVESIQVHPMPPSPYPEDVRRKGGVPEGATPLPKSAPKSVAADAPEKSKPQSGDDAVDPVDTSHADAHRWERAKAKSQAEFAADSDMGADLLEDADAACESDPFREAAPLKAPSLGKTEAEDFVLPIPELPPGVRPLVVDRSGSWTAPGSAGQSNQPVWERSQGEVVPPEGEIEDLEIEIDLPEVADSKANPTGAQTLAKLNFESLEFDADGVEGNKSAHAPTSPQSEPKSPPRPIWEDSESQPKAPAPVSSAHDPFAGEMSEQETVEALSELSDAEESVLEQINELEDELEREMEKIRRMEAQSARLVGSDDMPLGQEFVVVEEPSLFGELEDEDEESDSELEEDEEGAELEEGEEYEDEYEDEEEDSEAAELEEEEEEEEESELEEGEEYEEEEYEDEDEDEDEGEEVDSEAAELGEDDDEEEDEEEDEDEEGEEEEGELEEEESEEEESEEEEEGVPLAAELEEEEEEEEEDEDEEYEEYEYDELEDDEESDEDEDEEEDEEEEEEEEEASDEETEVELTPAPSGRKAAKRRSKWSHGDLVREAGAFLIERDRVGVSLLQRQFELEFEDAKALLDEFEEAGLIEPYMGGKKRAILLDLEAWLERSPTS